jgi:hypothetical protein
MKKFVAMTALAVLFAAGTASAQILGGGLGGALGGTLGGGLGGTIGAPIERTTGTIESASSGHGSVSGEKAVDARRGHAKASGSANGSIASTINGTLGPVATGSTNETSGSASGGGEANFMGTDAVLATGRGVVGAAGTAAGNVRGSANNMVGAAPGLASGVVGNASGAGSAAGSLSGSFLGSAGQLAAAGSAAAQGSGTFDVVSGMDVTDVKGRVIGEVVSVVSNARGVVQSVVVEAGDRTATIPAANFAGSGNVLVSGMSKGEVKSASRDQEAQ